MSDGTEGEGEGGGEGGEPEAPALPTRTLLSFFRATTSDAVTVSVRYQVPFYDAAETFVREHTLSDATLVEAALAREATTWDETDICAALDATMPT